MVGRLDSIQTKQLLIYFQLRIKFKKKIKLKKNYLFYNLLLKNTV